MAANKLTTARRSAIAKVNSLLFKRKNGRRHELIHKKVYRSKSFTKADEQELEELDIWVSVRIEAAYPRLKIDKRLVNRLMKKLEATR